MIFFKIFFPFFSLLFLFFIENKINMARRIYPKSRALVTAQIEEKNKVIFEENQTGLLQPHVKTHRGMMVKPKMILVCFRGFIHRHVEPRVKLYVPTEESFPLPLKYIEVTRTTDTTLDVMSEKH